MEGISDFIGLTEVPVALKYWMLLGPDYKEIEAQYLPIGELAS